ncbi:MAG: VWA domain-containing protein [Acidimicrobiales bacterium]|nr:VWA domain-containing protein [Acidimicrobiales bacterium]
MTFLAPSRLLLLALVVALAVAAVAVGRFRRPPAVRHPDVGLLDSVSPRWWRWRRHLVAGALVASLAGMVVGLARPARTVEVERSEAVVVLAIDVSRSMGATDVAPDRLTAAQEAAADFVADAPPGYRIGLVTFDTESHTLASPTTDRAELLEAISSLEVADGTAAGDGLATAVDVLEADAASATEAADDDTYRAVILLADGDSSVGVTLDEAAASAAEAEIPVFTIAYGTADAEIVVDGQTMAAGADPVAIAAVAEATGGIDYTASTSAELDDVYDRIGTTIAAATETQEMTVAFGAVAAVLLALAVIGSLLWTPRLT